MKKNYYLFTVILMMFFVQTSFGQSKTISGTVTEKVSGQPLPGVNVVIEGTATGSVTDFDGNYSINAEGFGNNQLVFSFLGYKTVSVSLTGEDQVINVALDEDATSLDEVVVTALGIKKEAKALGYSLTKVGGDDLADVKTTSAVNSLQGRVSGVNVSTSSAGAASSSRVIIRGASSLSGDNQPLYVIDGIPMVNTTKATVGTEDGHFGDGGDDVSGISPDDIESVSILKGAAAAALYGSLASNGVIMITTKNAKENTGFGVEYSTSFTFQELNTDLLDLQKTYGQGRSGLLPGYEWVRDIDGNPLNQVEIVGVEAQIQDVFNSSLNSWGARLDGTPVFNWQNRYVVDGVVKGKTPYSYTGDNRKKFYDTGSTAVNTVALTKGGENYSYRLSASFLGNDDLMPNSTLDRQSFSFNGRAQINPKLTSTINARYIIEKVHNRVGIGTWPGNANYTALNLPSNIDITGMKPGYIPEGTVLFDGSIPVSGTELKFLPSDFVQNPYWVANKFNNDDTKNRIIASATLRYDFTDWLYVNGRAGIDNYDYFRKQIVPFGTSFASKGTIALTKRSVSLFNTDVMLGFDKDITDKIGINSFVGGSVRRNKIESLNSNGDNFVVIGLEDLANTESQKTSFGFAETQTNSIYGSFEVDYNDYAYLTFTGRNDWFSTLSFPDKTTPNNEFYWSVSGSLLMHQALEMPEAIDFLKVRSSYALVAGGAREAYQLSLDYAILDSHLGNSFGTINGNNIPNPNLVPFQKTEFEIGIDGRFLENRLHLDFAYYTNETTDDIVASKASSTSGFTSAVINAGKLENNGIEFLIGGTPIKNDNFSWRTSFNMSYNKSEVTQTDETGTGIGLAESRTHTAQIRQEVGDPFGSIYGFSYLRDDAGNIMYDTSNPNLPRPLQGEFKKLGVGVAPYTLGLSNTFTYKNLSLSFLIDGKFGGQMFSGTNAYLQVFGVHKETLKGRENGLEVTGVDENGAPFTGVVRKDLLSQYYSHISDKIAEEYIRDTDFIKFRELSIGYNLPKKVLENIFVKDVRVSLIARDLFFIKRDVENIDPEAGLGNTNGQGLERFGVPATRSLGFSVNVKF